MRIFLLLAALLLSACATALTPGGRSVKVVHDGDAPAVARCERLGSVTGEAGSLLSGGEYGVFYATTDARNKAARIPGADTLVITDDRERRFGGEVSGVAYRCDRKPGTEPASAASPVSLVSPGAAPPAPHSGVTPVDQVFQKARKCQEKGGVWVNDQCVIPIE